jgi:tRNA(Ile2) C34 agmatinyltransferase TiaS
MNERDRDEIEWDAGHYGSGEFRYSGGTVTCPHCGGWTNSGFACDHCGRVVRAAPRGTAELEAELEADAAALEAELDARRAVRRALVLIGEQEVRSRTIDYEILHVVEGDR